MAISDMLNRRVRARPDVEEEVYASSSAEEASQDEAGEEVDSDEDQSQEDDGSDSNNEDEEEEGSDEDLEGEISDEDDDKDDFQSSLSNISFGALAKAQASMGPKKRKEKSDETSTASPLDDIRAKIREAREQKREAEAKASGSKDKKEKEKARTSKHAPMEQSSKRAVTRRRTVVEPPAYAKARDPRFDAAVMGYSGSGRFSEGTSKAYAFLDEYRADELKELKEQFSRSKNPAQKEALKAQIRSATDRLKADESKKREREVMAEHKQREKQLIREGKKSTPYFLKQSDLKKQVLEKKYESMKSKDRAKAMERRRKKMASKERKEMPWERRGTGSNDEPPSFGKRRRLE
ncbi:rRNA biogenesis protein rrp36 [Penicillium verhagenii]|nr:rRNA biogenesis protein rrp36 [Penicillium verhagenii]